MKILVINCGSSSIKYKVFEMPEERLLVRGTLEKIGEESSIVKHQKGEETFASTTLIRNHEQGLEIIARSLVDAARGVVRDVKEIEGVGHRVVHGGEGFDRSVVLSDDVIQKIEDYRDLAPLHNPHNLSGIAASRKFFPLSVQVGSFDTAFHTTIPEVAHFYAIPSRFYEKYRIRRYGFHGTSHRYVARRAADLLNRNKDEANIITCHLGNGCSIAAVREGLSVDTSMGFTPLEGLMMGTRSGDIDPGVIFYLAERLGLDLKSINNLLNKESGLLGISGVSNDFRNLLEASSRGNKNAALAVEMFCYRVKKYIGAYMAVLGRVHAIVFTAGIGENNPVVREKSLSGMEPLGVVFDKERNAALTGKEGVVTGEKSPIAAFVIPTDEELRIAYDTYQAASGTAG